MAHILEGSVRTSGDRVRITAQLISAHDGYHLWSHTYDLPAGDIFDIQDRISANIVDALRVEVLGDLPTVERTLPEAHALYLEGRYLERQGSAESMVLAGELFERALELDPSSSSARVALGPTLLGNLAVLVHSLGRLQDSIALQEYSVALAPVDPRAHFNLALAYYFAHRFDDAERSMRKTLVLSPRYESARYRLGTILLFRGEFEAARAAFESEEDDAYRVKGRALVASAEGHDADADAALRELIENWGAQWPSEVAQVHAFRGDLDAAFEWLEKDYEVSGAGGWGEWRLILLYDNLRSDPRWQQLLFRAGVSDAQLAAISFEITLPPSAADRPEARTGSL